MKYEYKSTTVFRIWIWSTTIFFRVVQIRVVEPEPEPQNQCCGSGMFIPDPESQILIFTHPGSRIQKQQ
jgi:hypothetical protein